MQIEGESKPRGLHCYLLQPGDDESDQRPMTQEEIEDLFKSSPQLEPGIDQNEDSEGSVEDLDAEEEAANVEGVNLLPPMATDPGDGLIEVDREGALVVVEDVIVPGAAFQVLEDEGPGDDEDDWVIDEELLWEATPKHQHLPDDVPVFSGHASSSSAVSPGHSATPAEVRRMLPMKQGVKIQHRSNKSGSRSAGWQCWYDPQLPSRWFSYGHPGGQYSDRDTALRHALEWLWEEDKQSNK